MNKFKFILSLLGITLLTSCGSDELAVDDSKISPEEERALVIEAGQDSEIPIMFGAVGSSGHAATRAPINSENNGKNFSTPAGTYMGVFCLAMAKQDEDQTLGSILPATSAAIDWTSPNHVKWLNNVPAKVVKYETGTDHQSPVYVSENYSDVQFMEDDLTGTKSYYYPFGNWYRYNFYAYYPRVSTPTVDASNVYVNYEITGKEDIIHGVATSTDNTYESQHALPFCAKYFRLKNGESLTTAFTDLPTLDLKHKLAKIVLVVQAHNEEHAVALVARSVALKGVTISGVYKDLRLCVASKASINNPTGQLAKQSNAVSGDFSIWKVADDTNPFANDATIAITAAETTVGYAMIPPTSLLGTNERYMIYLQMQQYGGDPLPDFPVVLENSDGSGMTLEAGHSYTIKLDIYSPSEIYVKATLTDWVDEDKTISVD